MPAQDHWYPCHGFLHNTILLVVQIDTPARQWKDGPVTQQYFKRDKLVIEAIIFVYITDNRRINLRSQAKSHISQNLYRRQSWTDYKWVSYGHTFGRALPLIIAVGKQVANSLTVARICRRVQTNHWCISSRSPHHHLVYTRTIVYHSTQSYYSVDGKFVQD